MRRSAIVILVLLIPAILSGIVLRAAAGPIRSLPGILLEVFLPFFFLFPFWRYFRRGICAGDIKLLMGAAALTSPRVLARLCAAAFFAAGAMSVLRLIESRGQERTIPFAVPVGFATALYLGGFL